MKEWPTDPLHQNNRFVMAMCDDFLETGTLSLFGPKASRVAEINRQISGSRGTAEQAPRSDNGD